MKLSKEAEDAISFEDFCKLLIEDSDPDLELPEVISEIPPFIKELISWDVKDPTKAMVMSDVNLKAYNRQERKKVRLRLQIIRRLVDPRRETIELAEKLIFEYYYDINLACKAINSSCHAKQLVDAFDDTANSRMKNNRLQKESLRRFVNKRAKHRRRRRKG